MSEWRACDKGPCSAECGHEGTCDEASGFVTSNDTSCHPYDGPCQMGGPEAKCRNHGGERNGKSLDNSPPNDCAHVWQDRPESDSRACLVCGGVA